MDGVNKKKVVALSASHGVNTFYLLFITPIIPLISAEFRLNYFEVGLIASIFAFANGVFQFPISFLGDYLGKWRTILVASLMVQSVPVFFYGFAPDYSTLLVLVFLSGLGCSAYHPPAVSLLTREMPEQRGLSMAYFAGGGEVGSILTPWLVSTCAVYFSWRFASHLAIFPAIIMASIIFILFKDSKRDERPIKQAALSTFISLTKNRSLMLLLLVSTFRITGFRGLMTFLPLLLAQQLNYEVQAIGWILSIYFVIGIITTFIVGKSSDRGVKTRYILYLTFLCSLAMGSLSFVSSSVGILFPIFLIGSFLTPVPSLVLAVGTELVDEEKRASAIGLIYAVNEMGSMVSPIVGGVMAEIFNLQFSFLLYASFFLIASFLAIILNRARKIVA
ncbi:MAG: MFS transporter [Nitrospinota bacterium]|nr:MFS transporter [Nitrospinota bacterium]